MRYLTVTTVLCLAASAALADGRIRDLSMTPNEMIQQNVQGKPGVPLGGSNLTPPGIDPNGNFANGQTPITGTPQQQPSKNYMDGYCDPNFRPLMSQSGQYAGIAACLQQQKEQACDMYRNLPNDARAAVDGTINCAARASNAMDAANEASDEDEEEGGGFFGGFTRAKPVSCTGYDAKRLNVLKQYWNDQNTAYALVFLPDLVMDNSGTCLNRR